MNVARIKRMAISNKTVAVQDSTVIHTHGININCSYPGTQQGKAGIFKGS